MLRKKQATSQEPRSNNQTNSTRPLKKQSSPTAKPQGKSLNKNRQNEDEPQKPKRSRPPGEKQVTQGQKPRRPASDEREIPKRPTGENKERTAKRLNPNGQSKSNNLAEQGQKSSQKKINQTPKSQTSSMREILDKRNAPNKKKPLESNKKKPLNNNQNNKSKQNSKGPALSVKEREQKLREQEKKKRKLQNALDTRDKNYLEDVEGKKELLSLSSDKLAKLMGDDANRGELIKRYGKLRLKYEMYLDRFLYWYSKGGKVSKVGRVNKDSFQIATDRIYTFDKVIKIWAIEQTPELLETDFDFNLKSDFIDTFPQCELMIKEVQLPYFINFEADDIIYQLSYWAKQAHNAVQQEEETNNDLVSKLMETTSKLNSAKHTKRMISSFLKIKEYQKKKFLFSKVYKFIYVYAPTNQVMKSCEESLKLTYIDHTITPIVNILPQFIKTFGSAFMNDYPMPMRRIRTQIQSDLDNAELTPYEQGTVGDKGICVGLDIETNLPVNIPLADDAKGKTILITGPTGEGKSAEAKGIALFHKINKDRILFMDYEGHEYDGFRERYGGIKISQSTSNSSCINTLVIGDCRDLSDKEANTRMLKARNATNRLFKILYADDIKELESADLGKLIDDALDFTYKKANVQIGHKHTYHNSASLKFYHLYEALEVMSHGEKTSKMYGPLLEKCINRLSTYWSKEGSKYYLFENEVSFDEIFKADVVQLSFGMAEQKETTMDEKELRLKYFNMDYILTEYAMYNRQHDIFTAVFIEELQRAAGSPFLLRLYNHLITGGRKLNLNNYVLTNSVLGLIDSDNEDAKAIRDNINILLIGNLPVIAREELIKTFGLQNIEQQIVDVATKPEYNYCFVLTYQKKRARETAIIKMDIPDEIMNNKVFKTRTVRDH